MEASLDGRAGVGVRNDREQIFRAVVIYEDVVAAGWGLKVCDRIRRAMGEGENFESSIWSFKVLVIPEVRNEAAAAAAGADVVIIAVSGENELSEAFKSWTSAWLWLRPEADQGAMLAILGDHATPCSDSIRAFFREVAKREGINLFTSAPEPILRDSATDSMGGENRACAGLTHEER